MGSTESDDYYRYTEEYWDKASKQERQVIVQENIQRAKEGKNVWNEWAANIPSNPYDYCIYFTDAVIAHRDFSDYLFPVNVNFENSTFTIDCNFHNIEFLGACDFVKVTFSDYVNFNQVTFSGSTSFEESTFLGYCEISHTKFLEYSIFSGISFEGMLNFDYVTFSDYVSFNYTTFRYSRFDRVTFIDYVEFSGAKFNDCCFFEDSQFNEVPNFTGATFKNEIQLASMKVPDMGNSFSDNVVYYRKLKEMAISSHDHDQELKFFAYEMKAKRKIEQNIWESIPGYLYQAFSDFGRSIWRPLFSLMVVIILSWVSLLLISKSIVGKDCNLVDPTYSSITYIINQTFPILLTSNDVKTIVGTCLFGSVIAPMSMKIIGMFQTLLSVLMLFLTGLAIRNRFKIK